MLKKIFGMTAVCVAFGATELKADFKADVLKVCSWFKADPKSEGVSELLEEYRVLYRDFQKGIVAYVRKFQEDCRKNKMDGKSPKNEINEIIEENEGALGNKMDGAEIEKILHTQKRDVDVVSFGVQLWTLVSEYSKKKTHEDFDFDENLSRAFRFVFYRRMCELVEVCLQKFAGRFDSPELFDKRKTSVDDKLLQDMEELFFYEPKSKGSDLFRPIGRLCEALEKITQKKEWSHPCLGAYYNLIVYSSQDGTRLLKFLNSLHGRLSNHVKREKFLKKDFLKFLKDKSTKELLEIKRKYVEQNKEADSKIRSDVEYKNLAFQKDEVCYALKDISREYEKNRNLASYYDDLLLKADPDLAEIALEMGSKNKYDEIKKEMQENAKKANEYWNETKRLRPLLANQRVVCVILTDDLNEMYSKRYSKLSVDEKDMFCVDLALCFRQAEATFRSFFYCNTLRCNIVRDFTDRVVFKDMNKMEKHDQQASAKLELTDDFEQEYILLVRGRHRSSSLDKRRSKIRMECEESVLINEESLNTGFIRENNERERGKSTGLKRTKRI